MSEQQQRTAEKQLYRKGTLILMQRGEYSDKSTVGLFRALVDFYGADAVKRYKERFPMSDPDDEYSYSEYEGKRIRFEAMLIQDGYIEELEYSVMHTGSYCDLGVA